MAFNSLSYAIFLIVTLIISWGLQRYNAFRLVFLTASSFFFYMCSRPDWVWLLLASTVVDYIAGLQLGKTDNPKARKLILGISLSFNLGLLGTFKYYDFFVESIHAALVAAGLSSESAALPLLRVALPVGISFYTFQTMAYTIDVYRRQQAPIQSFTKFALFVTFFPQLVAGPIVLAQDLLPQLENRPRVTREQVSDGVFLLIKGLIKKVAIADWLGLNLVDRLYDNTAIFSSAEALVALVGYSMQIYADFSGYTDMAIGSGKLFGYELPENFQRPYQALTVAAFWRRWHMTLSTWVRSYIYFPLGGTRGTAARTYFNLVASLVIMGIWHGANWTFFWYGVIHGGAVAINRYFNQKRKKAGIKLQLNAWGIAWRWAATFAFVCLARILFRSDSLSQAWVITKQLWGHGWTVGQLPWQIWFVLGLTYAVHFLPASWVDKARLLFREVPATGKGVILAIICGWMVHLANTQPVPFIYFQF